MTMNAFSNLSIVIPVGPDDSAWRVLLSDLSLFGSEPEIILSACQPRPDGRELPEHARWIQASKGRARQLNSGANASTRQVIWFLHADTRLTATVADAVERFAQNNHCCLGYFILKFSDDGPRRTLLNAWAANLRSSVFGLPFGDQGLLVQRAFFHQIHGFDERVEPGEDLDFIVRAKAAGIQLKQIPAELITSARRYRQQGWLMTTLRHLYLTGLLTVQARRRLKLTG